MFGAKYGVNQEQIVLMSTEMKYEYNIALNNNSDHSWIASDIGITAWLRITVLDLVYCVTGHVYAVCRRSQTAGRNSCSIVSGDVSNCSYHLKVHPVTSSCLSSA